MDAPPSVASLFCVGLSGLVLSDEDKRVLSLGVGGIVLFSRNVDTPEQVAMLIEEARGYAGDEVLASVDQEGGTVARLEQGFQRIPTMRTLGEVIAQDPDKLSIAYEVGQCLGQDLRGVGFDMDFAPVLDVDTNPDNPVIGDRSISNDPKLVAKVGQQLIAGLQSQGIVACGKHFPGHGDTQQDSHFELPRLPHAMDRMEEIELYPFAHVVGEDAKQGALAIMTAHVVFDAIHNERPGTLCPEVLTDRLRKAMEFEGLCISDCMEMKAIADGAFWGGTVGACVRGIGAGLDMALVCHTHEVMHASIDAVDAALKDNTLSEARVAQALARLERARGFRRELRNSTIAPFEPSDAFRQFIGSSTATGADPTWETVVG
ncbi:MAG: beta-N-acetylhexosaminidase [Verrucomicrobiaceae bacterium]|nr:beta-N-acetylhexosaminidase [Verrucomicrobiaceae bacterium]